MGKLEARWVKLISEPALRSKNDSCFFLGLRESDLAICTCKHSEASEGNYMLFKWRNIAVRIILCLLFTKYSSLNRCPNSFELQTT